MAAGIASVDYSVTLYIQARASNSAEQRRTLVAGPPPVFSADEFCHASYRIPVWTGYIAYNDSYCVCFIPRMPHAIALLGDRVIHRINLCLHPLTPLAEAGNRFAAL